MKKDVRNSMDKGKSGKAEYRCPSTLAQLIDDVNLVDPKADLPNWFEVFDSEKLLIDKIESTVEPSERSRLRVAAVRRIFDTCFENMPLELLDRWTARRVLALKDPDDPLSNVSTVLEVCANEYSQFRLARRDLYLIASYFQARVQSINAEEIAILPPVSLSLRWNGKIGYLDSDQPSLAATLDGVRLDRIRICNICERLFWANNDRSKTDSQKCSDVYRQRVYYNKKAELARAKKEIRSLTRLGIVRNGGSK